MGISDILVLLIAGLGGGVMNSIAGGGTFITFPALLFVGVPPIAANATNTFSSCSGYLSGMFAYRQDLMKHKDELVKFIVFSLIGGIGGAWLLLQTPENVFEDIIPWLLLFATVVFIAGPKLNAMFRHIGAKHKHASTVGMVLGSLLLLGVCTYGGFFNAGLGIISLSYLALSGYSDINAMNGIKLLVSSVVSIVAIVLFAINGTIVWEEGLIVLVGTVIGGYVSARITRQVPQQAVRQFVIFISIAITGYFFYATYA